MDLTTPVDAYLLDGTYELFRSFFGAPSAVHEGREVGATRGLLRSFGRLVLDRRVTHGAVAFDTVIESFRNRLFDGYKTGAGLDPILRGQFPLAEAATTALGFTCWPMTEFEADDALATAALGLSELEGVRRAIIATPDKDLAQCLVSPNVVRWDRKKDEWLAGPDVVGKYGVEAASIPSWLALVGDSADGIPGIPGWGAKSAATVLRHYATVDRIPEKPDQWEVKVRGAQRLSANLEAERGCADLYVTLATLRRDVPIDTSLDALRYDGPDENALRTFCSSIGDERFADRFVAEWANRRTRD